MIAALVLAAAVGAGPRPDSVLDPLPPPTDPAYAAHVDWATIPAGRELLAVFPRKARFANQDGRATVDCRIAANGSLESCKVVSESPQGAGFGDSGLHAAALFKARPNGSDGQSVVGKTARLPIRFLQPRMGSLPAIRAPIPGVTEGRAQLDCRTTDAHTLDDCLVLSQDADRPDLPDLALAVASALQLPGTTPVRVRVMVPVHVVPESEPAPKP